MSETTKNNGRLGNQFIRNVAVSLIAQKHNLKVNYCNIDLFTKLGIDLFSGSNVHQDMIILNDENYFSIYNCGNLNNNINPNFNFFQTKDIIHFLYNYLHTDEIKSKIIEKNPFNQRYNTNNDLFIHIRLGDATIYNPGISYYLNAIKIINFDNLYLSTDDKNHNIVKTIIQSYPNAKLIEYDEIATFQYASTCKHIILSHGSFSATIGYLSFFSNIYYSEYHLDVMWHGDMFSINNWIKCKLEQTGNPEVPDVK